MVLIINSREISSRFVRSQSPGPGSLTQQPGAQGVSPHPGHTQTPGPSTTSPVVQSTAVTPSPGQSDEGYRLPSDLKPIYYDLDLAPDIYGDDPATFSFQGHVGIVMECVSPTSTITLNAKNLSIAQSGVAVSGVTHAGTMEVVDMEMNDEEDRLSIVLSEELQKGEQYRVDIDFSGPLTNDLTGLYLSSYVRGNETV